MALHALPQDTVRLIKSTQVITTPASIVKELVENSLDADATTISIKMENSGFSRLEVRDNGSGIQEEDVKFIAKPHYTSKIASFSDLASLTSYGFRGEALASLCAVADVMITTKTKESTMGHVYSFDHQGNISEKKPAATPKGTTVVASNLFKNVPVRRQFYSTPKRRRDELKKVEDLVLALSLAVPNIHLTLSHDKINIIQKNPAQDIRTALMNTFPGVFKDLVSKIKIVEDIQLEVHLPDPSCPNQSFSRTTPDRLFISVNQRPVTHKAIEKMVKAHYSLKSEGCHGRYPTGVVALTLPTDAVDVNLEPNKNKVLLQEEDIILEILKVILTELYGSVDNLKKPDRKQADEVNTDITCTFACVSQHQEKKNSFTFKKSNCQSKFDSSNSGGNDHLFDTQDTKYASNPCLRSNVMTKKQSSLDIDQENFNFMNQNSGILNRQKAGNLDPHPLQQNVVTDGMGNDNHSSADKVNVGKTQQEITSSNSNKENIVNVKRNMVTSTQNSRVEGIFSSASESCISLDEDFRNKTEETDFTFRLFSSRDSKISDSTKENISGIVPLSNLSSCNSDKASENSRPGTPVQPISTHVRDDPNNSSVSPRSKHESSHLHESLMGSDGIPVFKIAPLQPDDVHVSNMDDEDCHDFRTEKNQTETNFGSTESAKVQTTDARHTLIPSENNVEKEARALPNEESQEPSNSCAAVTDNRGSWSRGHTAGGNIQTVQLVNTVNAETKQVGRKISLGSGISKRTRPVTSAEDQGCQSTSPKKPKVNSLGSSGFDYIHGKPVKKPSSPFILFSRDIRNQVLSENPGADFAFIAKEMAARWKTLDSETKSYYTEQAKVETEKYQEEVRKIREKRSLNNTLNSSGNTACITKGSLDRYVAPMTPLLIKSSGKCIQKQAIVTRKPWLDRSKEINVTLENIKEVLDRKCTNLDSNSTMILLGPLSSFRGWMCLQERNITALNTFRLHETVLVNDLLKTFRLPVKDLTDSIPFNTSTLGTENWNVLLNLRREVVPSRNFYTVIDSRLTFSGFRIALYQGTNNSIQISHGEIIGLSDAIGFYGINDFKELLAVLVTHPSASIEQTRPLKLQHWIKGEAVRMIRSGPSLVRREDILEKLDKWHRIQQDLESDNKIVWEKLKCIHNKLIFTPVYSLDDLPQSQCQSQSFDKSQI